MNDKKITGECCGRPMQYATESKCNYNDCCMDEYCGRKLGRIKEMEPTCDSTAVIPSITVESVEGITNLANCLVHVNDINTTFYVDDKHRVMITWAGPVDIPGYDMENNPNGYRDQIVTDIEKGIAVIYDKHGKGYTFGIYDSLDSDGAIAQAINDKLDEMAADGTLADIISEYIGEPVYGFDTVADMKASTTLQAGDRARTLGFYTINDGGGALYKITDTGTANEMDVIAVESSLYANLIYGKSINVKQVGAYGDGTNNDYAAVNRAYQIANTNSIVLEFPKATYKVNEQLVLKHIVIDCKGKIDNTSTLILGANSNGSTKTNVHIAGCNDVQIEGAKNSYFNIEQCSNLTVFANGSVTESASTAYCKIDGVTCSSITLNGINNGWINENEFNIKRCLGDLSITGDGTYSHNNNRFNNVCIEGNSKHITIDYGHSNYISYRGEGNPTVTLSQDPAQCFGNEIKRQEASVYGNVFTSLLFNANTTFNQVGMSAIPNYKSIRILDLNLSNVKSIDNNLIINDDGVISGGWANEYLNSNIDPSMPFVVSLFSDARSQRIYISCYDTDGNIIDGNVNGAGVTKDPNTNIYRNTVDVDKVIVSYAPTSGVARVEVKITTGSNANKFTYAIADVYTPFMNMSNFNNTISTIKKTRSSSPATWTALNPTWEVGDIIYNSTPTPGGVYAWVCTTAGTGSASVWKTISISA